MIKYLTLTVFAIPMGRATFSVSSHGETNKLSKVIIEPEVDSIMTAKWNHDFKAVSCPEQMYNG